MAVAVMMGSMVASAARQTTPLADFERALATMREPADILGMSAVIAQHGDIIWSRGFGVAHRERNLPATPDTIYHLASVTKPYAATIVLQLVDDGKLDLDQPVSQFGINLDGIGTGAHVRHLLSHTAVIR